MHGVFKVPLAAWFRLNVHKSCYGELNGVDINCRGVCFIPKVLILVKLSFKFVPNSRFEMARHELVRIGELKVR